MLVIILFIASPTRRMAVSRWDNYFRRAALVSASRFAFPHPNPLPQGEERSHARYI